MLVFHHECSHCAAIEERLFTDSYTGMELCTECLSRVVAFVTNSPSFEGDNLKKELNKRAG